MSTYDNLKFLWPETPPYLIYWVTQNCNFTCDHCFNHVENKKVNNDLSLEEIGRVSSHLKHLKYVTLAGGEPFIRTDLADIVEIFYRQNGLQMLLVVTNGWFTDRTVAFAEDVLKRCPKLHLSITVSIDGPREVHDHIRRQVGSFDRCIATLHALTRVASDGTRFSPSAGGTYNRENAATIADVATFVQSEFAIPYFVNLIRGEDVQNNSLKAVDIDHFKMVADHLNRTNQAVMSPSYPFRSVRLAVYQTVSEIIYDSAKNDAMTAPCKAGKRGFVLSASGEILLCEVLDIRLGNVRTADYDPMRILHGPTARAAMERITAGKCHCTWECFQTMNAVFSPRVYPRVAGHMLKNFLGREVPPAVPAPNPHAAAFRPNRLASLPALSGSGVPDGDVKTGQ